MSHCSWSQPLRVSCSGNTPAFTPSRRPPRGAACVASGSAASGAAAPRLGSQQQGRSRPVRPETQAGLHVCSCGRWTLERGAGVGCVCGGLSCKDKAGDAGGTDAPHFGHHNRRHMAGTTWQARGRQWVSAWGFVLVVGGSVCSALVGSCGVGALDHWTWWMAMFWCFLLVWPS